jgi:hypothetical protein
MGTDGGDRVIERHPMGTNDDDDDDDDEDGGATERLPTGGNGDG